MLSNIPTVASSPATPPSNRMSSEGFPRTEILSNGFFGTDEHLQIELEGLPTVPKSATHVMNSCHLSSLYS